MQASPLGHQNAPHHKADANESESGKTAKHAFAKQPLLLITRTSIGLKLIMALTGGALILFLLAHVAGNLQIFLGPDKLNAYAQGLQDLGPLLWVARIGLLAIFVLHIQMGARLRRMNRRARPTSYKAQSTVQASIASRTMLQTGLVILAFVILHLWHFTFGGAQPEFFHLVDAKGRHDVYSMIIHGFQDRGYAALYIVCLSVLGVHLSHAISSMWQTLGWYSTYATPLLRRLAPAIAGVIVLAYVSIPLAVQFGVLKLVEVKSETGSTAVLPSH